MGKRRKVLFITANAHKVQEIQELAAAESRAITIEHLDYDYPELQLDTLEEVARESATYIQNRITIKRPFFLEDSGLHIPVLNGFPGPFSAFVFRTIGNEGIVRLMAGQTGEARTATFKTVVAYCASRTATPLLFVGAVNGRIAETARGTNGFGYDPLFEISGKTFAEMSRAEKNERSHRSRAFMKFLAHIA
ncbi:MAG TPA: RdgB/HAM1 family non-canonical purine NTP pyrophosphatase [Methanomicrobia archaeon]|nr:RdgB/HAM1 family non-canonical purine NTP pyrophosphatase [Methanomicrobia archaeon]